MFGATFIASQLWGSNIDGVDRKERSGFVANLSFTSCTQNILCCWRTPFEHCYYILLCMCSTIPYFIYVFDFICSSSRTSRTNSSNLEGVSSFRTVALFITKIPVHSAWSMEGLRVSLYCKLGGKRIFNGMEVGFTVLSTRLLMFQNIKFVPLR